MACVMRCSICRGKFPWDQKKGFPKFCPECGKTLGADRADDDIVMPFIRTGKMKATDDVYRKMEKGSETRMELAAAQAGVPVEDMSSLKITNLRDCKEGEVAAVPVENTVTKHMEAANQQGGMFGFQGSAGSEYAAGCASGDVTVNGKTTRGIAPRAGATAMSGLQRIMGK